MFTGFVELQFTLSQLQEVLNETSTHLNDPLFGFLEAPNRCRQSFSTDTALVNQIVPSLTTRNVRQPPAPGFSVPYSSRKRCFESQ